MKDATQTLPDTSDLVNKAWATFNKRCNQRGKKPDQTLKCYQGLGACWEWTGGKDQDGYGHAAAFGVTIKAHRLSYILHTGAIPNKAQVLHRCDSPSCVNPEHLFLGTARDNMTDKKLKKRCNPARGVRGGSARLTECQVFEIRELRQKGVPSKRLSKQYGVSQAAICHIVSGRNWAHLPRGGDWI